MGPFPDAGLGRGPSGYRNSQMFSPQKVRRLRKTADLNLFPPDMPGIRAILASAVVGAFPAFEPATYMADGAIKIAGIGAKWNHRGPVSRENRPLVSLSGKDHWARVYEGGQRSRHAPEL